MNSLGIDACRMGWCVIGEINSSLVWGCYKSIKEVEQAFPAVETILIDIPVGLSSLKFERTIDIKARQYLKNRKSSIFSPPCREAVYTNPYQAALKLNRQVIGKGMSIQAYNLSPKIKEIDEWLDSKPEHIRVFEAHPELCFKSLNKTIDLQFSKHDKAGVIERQEVLFAYDVKLLPIYKTLMKSYKRSEVKPDDILDAMSLFATSHVEGRLLYLQDENSIDETGKSVGMVYGNSGLN